jgi:hypothetical protein
MQKIRLRRALAAEVMVEQQRGDPEVGLVNHQTGREETTESQKIGKKATIVTNRKVKTSRIRRKRDFDLEIARITRLIGELERTRATIIATAGHGKAFNGVADFIHGLINPQEEAEV